MSLDLVYNPGGPFLPPPQEGLESDYKQRLFDDFGVVCDQLLTISNMPISRFGGMLLSKGIYDDYLQLLKDNFSESNLQSVMCKTLVSVDWQGFVYDCDFNQMLSMPLMIGSDKHKTHIKDILAKDIENQRIVIGDHCYGCTAGQGSSCGGALSE